jgi:hypothetical protein
MYRRFVTIAKKVKKGGPSSFLKIYEGLLPIFLQKLTPDGIGYTVIYFNIDETPQM